jgi:hypothetical protein
MTLRAVLAGLALGLLISALTLFNDGVIQGTWLISNHFPVSVFAAVVLLLLVANPLLRCLGARWPLSLAEVAVIAALGLTACGWPSFGYFWGFIPNTVTPPHWMHTMPAWQANQVMSYVPGVSNELGHGHVQDWRSLASDLLAAEAGDTSVAGQIRSRFQSHEHDALQRLVSATEMDHRAADTLLTALNRVIREGRLEAPPDLDPAALPASVAQLLDGGAEQDMDGFDRSSVNRWLMVAAFPRAVMPPPAGRGALLSGTDRAADVREMIIVGGGTAGVSVLREIPWSAWWPTIRLWGGLGLVLGIASLCLAMVVHPQWSRRELLLYPLAQFVTELGQRRPDRALPQVAFNHLFWVGLLVAAGIHLVNGMAAWFPSLHAMTIPLKLDFSRLTQLMPNAARLHGMADLLWPYLYLSVIGFAFFLNTRISFSVGISCFVYVIFSAALMARGIGVEQNYLGATRDSMMRFGAYLGFTGIIIYVGRHYYRHIAMGMVGMRSGDDTPAYAIWAGRGLMLCIIAATFILRSSGLDWVLSSLFVLLVMVMFLVMSRIVAETGLFFVQAWWMPVAVLTGLLGTETLGPTSYILLALASILIVGDPRTTIMPYLVTALQLVDRTRPAESLSSASPSASTPARFGPVMLLMIVAGFLVAGLATFTILHDRGITSIDGWAGRSLPMMPFDELSKQLADMRTNLTVADATANDGLSSLRDIRLSPKAWGWISVGVGLITLCALARLRLPWWPIHPVLFLIWGTMPSSRLAVSFLLGWAIKLVVIKTTGVRGYRAVLPLMVGVIAGELLAGIGWIAVGWVYYLSTGLIPASYRIYP